MAKILYGGFWDRPLAFLVEHKNRLFLFLREFDDEVDEYEDAYRVFIVPHTPSADLTVPASWESYIQASNFIGTVQVADVQFDETHRKEINTSVIDSLLQQSRPATD